MSLPSVDAPPQPGVSFFVAGDPAPQGSKQARPIYKGRGKGRVFTGRVALVESSTKVKPWREQVAAAARIAYRGRAPMTGPLEVSLVFEMPRPQSHWGTGRNAGVLKASAPEWCDKKPDKDKLTRAIYDALTTAGVWLDDAQAVIGRQEKLYANDSPGVHIQISPAARTV